MNLLPMNNRRTVNLGENIAYINKKLEELESMGEKQTEGNWSGEYCYTIFRSGTCSNCGERAPTRNYCCYCGAKMRSAYHNPKTEKIMEEIEDEHLLGGNMSRTGSIRKMDRRRYWRVRAEFLRWWDKRPP